MYVTGSLASKLLARIVVTISIDIAWVSLFDENWSTNGAVVSEVLKQFKTYLDKVQTDIPR